MVINNHIIGKGEKNGYLYKLVSPNREHKSFFLSAFDQNLAECNSIIKKKGVIMNPNG